MSVSSTPEVHLSHRSNWLRAAVLGANDGILSTAASCWAWRRPARQRPRSSPLGSPGCRGRFVDGCGRVRLGQLAARRRGGRHPPGGARAAKRSTGRATRAGRALRGAGPTRRWPARWRSRSRARARLPGASPRRARARPAAARTAVQAAWASAVSFSTGAAVPLLAVALAPAATRVGVTVVVTLDRARGPWRRGRPPGRGPAAPRGPPGRRRGAVAMAITAAIGALVGTAI